MTRTIALLLATTLAFACQKTESTTTVADPNQTETLAATETTVTSPAGTAAPTTTSALSETDREFVTKAAKIGMAEVQLATNVTQRAQSPDVKAYANQMLADHNASNRELTLLAANKGVDPPSDIDPDKKALDAELAKLTGAALDKAYMTAMVKDHAAAAADFEKASQQLTDPDVKTWAMKTLPVLHTHHASAEQIAAKLK
jgi:putative membrane protein